MLPMFAKPAGGELEQSENITWNQSPQRCRFGNQRERSLFPIQPIVAARETLGGSLNATFILDLDGYRCTCCRNGVRGRPKQSKPVTVQRVDGPRRRVFTESVPARV